MWVLRQMSPHKMVFAFIFYHYVDIQALLNISPTHTMGLSLIIKKLVTDQKLNPTKILTNIIETSRNMSMRGNG